MKCPQVSAAPTPKTPDGMTRSIPFVAEDLGLITADVRALCDEYHLPRTRVLQFAFDGTPDNPHFPHHYAAHTVAYTGSHDNFTARGWFDELPGDGRQILWRYLQRPEGAASEAAAALVRLGWSSTAALSMAPLQDLLNQRAEARMNVPGHAEGNWRWRCTDEMPSAAAFQWLRDLTEACNRSSVPRQKVIFPQATEVNR